jgi:hypothetical protein
MPSETSLQERVDVKAYNSDGSYYKLSAMLILTSDRTKVELNYLGIYLLVVFL